MKSGVEERISPVVLMEMKRFLTDTLRELMALSGAQKGSLFLYKPETAVLELAAFFSPSGPPVETCRWSVGEGVCGKVLEGRDPVLVKDISNDSRFSPNGFSHYRTSSFISLPLVGPRERPVGLINLSDKSSGGQFSEQDMDFVSTIAGYGCIIANNMSVFDTLKREKKRIEDQKEMFAKYASVGKLAAGVVHEINNPLDGIIRFTNMLLGLQDGDPLQRDYLLEIKSGLSKIENVTRSLLQFSHHVNPKRAVIRNYVELDKIVEEALIACEVRSRADITVRTNILMRRRMLDMGLSQVFINLIQKAFDAMPAGGNLDIEGAEDASLVRIRFRDSGGGIPAGLKERIFDPFYTDKHNASRPGLGLAKCREIVERYSGTIDVESTPGKGSSFNISLPAKFIEHE
jgi:signal transduction histidine kinase